MELTTIINFASTEAEAPEGISALGLDPLAILAQALTFVVLFWIIKKFAMDNIIKTLETRRKTIDDGVRLGREMEAEKELLDQKIEKALKTARSDADEIIAQSKTEAGEIIKAGEVSAQKKIDTMIADAKKKIDEDIESARKSLEDEMRSLVAEATEAILEEKIDATKDASLIDKAIAKVRAL